jgi:hypothetical protein
MNRIVLAFTIHCILLSGAAITLAQGRNQPPPGREPPKDAAAERKPQRPPEARPQQSPPAPGEDAVKESLERGPQRAIESRPPPPRGPAEPTSQYKPVVLQLRTADCMEVAEMLDRIFFDGIVVPVQHTNSIVYAGPEDTLPQVRELIAGVDVPAGDAATTELTMIPVRHRHVDEIADDLAKIMGGRGARELRIAADKGRSTLLIRGAKVHAETAKTVVDELDKPAGSVAIEFAFFHSDLNRKEPFSAIPPDLAQVAEDLKRFGAIELMGRLSTIAVENDRFRVGGSIVDSIPQVQVEGELVSASSDGAVKLRLKARLMLDRQNLPPPPPPSAAKGDDKEKPAPQSGPRPAYELDTAVSTKRGDYVVLGSAPAGWKPGESVILVMYARP